MCENLDFKEKQKNVSKSNGKGPVVWGPLILAKTYPAIKNIMAGKSFHMFGIMLNYDYELLWIWCFPHLLHNIAIL